MEAVREVTVWTGVDYRQPNHDYLLDGDRVVAYRPWGSSEIQYLSGKIKIDRRGRKFERLAPNPFKGYENLQPALTYKEVKGSKGAVYRVDLESKTCTCPGFKFRGSCKHVVDILAQ